MIKILTYIMIDTVLLFITEFLHMGSFNYILFLWMHTMGACGSVVGSGITPQVGR
jgi:hypothetical protein